MQESPSKPLINPKVRELDLNKNKRIEFARKKWTKLHLNIRSGGLTEEAPEPNIAFKYFRKEGVICQITS